MSDKIESESRILIKRASAATDLSTVAMALRTSGEKNACKVG